MFPPIDTVIGKLPDGAFEGICTLSCIIPATMPGASPAYTYSAGCPLIVTPTGNCGAGVTCGGGKVAAVIVPVTLGGLVWPSPSGTPVRCCPWPPDCQFRSGCCPDSGWPQPAARGVLREQSRHGCCRVQLERVGSLPCVLGPHRRAGNRTHFIPAPPPTPVCCRRKS